MPVEPECDTIRQKRMENFPVRLRLLGASSLLLLCTGCSSPSSAHNPSSNESGSTSDANVSSNASCVAPYLSDQPPSGPFQGPEPTVSPDATITIYGHWYTSTCNDTGDKGPLESLPPVRLNLMLPGGIPQILGEFQPSGQDMGFSVKVQVPAATRAGTATIRDDRKYPATYDFQVAQ